MIEVIENQTVENSARIKAEEYAKSRISLTWKIVESESFRKRLIDILYSRAESVSDEAEYGLMLGTSPTMKKFEDRVAWGAHLFHSGKIQALICSGSSDDETKDINQAESAKKMAIEKYNVPEEKIICVGGNNTDENIFAVEKYFIDQPSLPKSILLISENRHLIRTTPSARYVLERIGISTNPSPVGGIEKIDPNDPEVILELAKAAAYNHTISGRTNYPPELRPEVQAQIDKTISEVKSHLSNFRNE